MNYPPPQPYQNQSPTTPQAPQPQRVPVRRNISTPYVTYLIMGVTIFVFLLQTLDQAGVIRQALLPLANTILGPDFVTSVYQAGFNGDLLTLMGAKITDLIARGQLWRLITPVLLHANLPNIYHIGFNMYALYAFGPMLESFYGRWRYLALYVLGAFGGNVLSFVLTPQALSVGASTAIFGLVAAEGVLIYQNRAMFGQRARPMLTNVVVVVVINLVLGFSGALGVDNFGHLGGLAAGLIFAWFAGPVMAVEGIWPSYTLVNKRSAAAAWVAGIAVFALFSAITVYGMIIYH